MSADEHNLGVADTPVPIRTEHDSLIAATDSVDDSEVFGAVPPTVLESMDIPLLASTDLDVLPMPAAMADDLAAVLDPFALDAVVADDTEDDVFEEDGTMIDVAEVQEPAVTEAALFDGAPVEDEDDVAVISSNNGAARARRAKRGRATRLQATVAADSTADVRSRMLRHEQRARDAPPVDEEVAAALQRARPQATDDAEEEVVYDDALLQKQHTVAEEQPAVEEEAGEIVVHVEAAAAYEVVARDDFGNIYEPLVTEDSTVAAQEDATVATEPALHDVQQRREAVHEAYSQRVAVAEEAAVKLQALAAELATPEALQRELAALEAARVAAAGIDPLPLPMPVTLNAVAAGDAPGMPCLL